MTDARNPATRPLARTRLTSYGGIATVAQVCTPDNEDALEKLLRDARQSGRRVTFRAGGTSFDSQSLNDDLVISLERFRDIEVDEVAGTVTVGAGARWGDILRETSKRGFLPHIVVTTRRATAGGTLSAHSVSRFTPSFGREGGHVLRFRMMLVDGTMVECSRTLNPDLFRTTIGGFGYVGAVLEITYALMPAPSRGGRIVVETEFVRITGAETLVELLLAATPEREVETWDTARAATAAIYLRGEVRALLLTSRYREGRATWSSRSTFHYPRSPLHWMLQFAAQVKPLRELAYRMVFDRGFTTPRVFVDDLFGYTFFQDGHEGFHRFGKSLSLAMGIRHETYMIPCDRADVPASARRVAEFLHFTQRLFEKERLSPALVDALFCPADHEFALSSSRDQSSLAITITFEDLASSRLGHEEAVFRELATECARLGGRVHLVKQVFADPREIDTMYHAGIDEMRRVRARVGAVQLLTNEFLRRVLPRLAEA
jgi:decaprenylphospho-beta-D-ribofuranose 2-oxidase